MALPDGPMKLPDYYTFSTRISILDLPISSAELHGVLCGYLAAGGDQKGELYLRALLANRTPETRPAATALFDILAISQHQMSNLEFDFELLLPDDSADLVTRAQAFSEWCEGFTQGLTVVGLDFDALKTEDTQEAVEHLTEFAQLDYEALRVDEEDERALTEVIEYTRMAVLSIHAETHSKTADDQETH